LKKAAVIALLLVLVLIGMGSFVLSKSLPKEHENSALKSSIKSVQNEPIENRALPLLNPVITNKDELLKYDDHAEKEILAVLPKLISEAYPYDEYKVWKLEELKPLSETDSYFGIGINQGGKEMAENSWIATLKFPKLGSSESLSQGQLFIVKTKKGWIPWYTYH